ncbi:hypothetical protein ACIQBJ_28390 [Kitasatospora sp. NPDC088391]|uniref:hypothetical protein n=1 Tax=Kitasatospora sp. NPDC088391 TaxID=3364074 RepID=UPI0037F8CDE1
MLLLRHCAASSGADGFPSSWTWGAVIAVAALLVGTWLTVSHRRQDRTVRWLEPGYETAGTVLIVLNRLSLTIAVEGVTSELPELVDLVSKLRIAEQRSPDLPFGTVIAALEKYRTHALPQDHVARLAEDGALLADHLALAQAQGVVLEAARTATVQVQRAIERRTRH